MNGGRGGRVEVLTWWSLPETSASHTIYLCYEKYLFVFTYANIYHYSLSVFYFILHNINNYCK